MEELRDQGLWWLPGHEDAPVAGTLIVEHDAFPRLELIGALGEFAPSDTAATLDIVLGIAGGHPVTLYNCVLAGSKIHGIHTEWYVAQFVLRGAHLPEKAAVVFHHMAVAYDALFEWAGLSGLRTEHTTDPQGHLESIKAEFRFPEAPAFNIEGATI